MKVEDKILLDEIKKRNRKVFEALYYEYYPHLTRYAEGFLFDKQAAKILYRIFSSTFGRKPNDLTFRTR